MTDSDAAIVREAIAASLQDLARQDAAAALRRLDALSGPLANDPMVHLHVALAHKQTGDLQAEMAALTRALEVNPYFYPALLQAATWCERRGRRRAAARFYENALQAMPPAERRNPAMQTAVAHAEAAVRANEAAVAAHVDRAMAVVREAHREADLTRLDETVDVFLGRKRAYLSRPTTLLYTRLPALPFYPRELLPWLQELEASADVMRDEITPIVAESLADFPPCVALPAGAPVNQWAELNHSKRWSAYHLWRSGVRQEANCSRCPRTAELLERLPLARVAGVAPNVMVSCLEGQTRIPPHHGDTNSRLLVQLPLVVPGPCTLRVGNDVRAWDYGKALVFDEAIEHEGRNDGTQLCVTLTFDVWNPYLSEAERTLLATAVAAAADYYRAEP